MKETNLMSSPRLIGRCCLKEYLYSKTTLMLLIFMLPLAAIAQVRPSQELIKQKEASHQEYLQSIYGNKPETELQNAARVSKAKELTETQKQQMLEDASYEELIAKFKIDKQEYLDRGFTKAEILEEINRIKLELENPNNSTIISNNPALTDGMMSRSGGGDYCSDAVVLECGVPSVGDTYAAYQSGVVMCGASPNDGSGVWYKFTGNGVFNNFTITSASPAPAQIRLYTSGDGTCSSLQCASIAGQGSASISNFLAAFEETYYILVSGFAGSGTNFTIERTSAGECFDTPPGDGLSSETAYQIACGDIATGSTVGAAPTEVPSYCGTTVGSTGVWYQFTVEEGQPEDITVSLCDSDFDNSVNVYTGTPGSLTCVGGASYTYTCTGSYSNRAAYVFNSPVYAGETYYIYISNGFGSATGNYELELICDGDGAVQPPSVPANDLCPDAIEMICGETYDGQNIAATTADQPSTGDCSGSISSNSPGVWYKYTGDGSVVTVSTCGFDTELFAYTGSCGAFTCVADNDDTTVPTCTATTNESQVSFETIDGEEYYFYVVGWNGNTGEFTITLECEGPLENDDCAGALDLFCGDSIEGSTVAASNSFPPTCDYSFSSPGVWYKHIGTGELLTIDLSGSTYDTKIALYTGSCGALTCVAGDDDGGTGVDSRLDVSTTLGETYYLYVGGWGSSSAGSYIINVTCQPDPCEEAETIACGETATGTTIGGSTAGPQSYCGTTPGTTGVYYRYVGTDEFVTASLCNSDYDTKMNVYQGACGSLSCVGGNDDSCGTRSEFTWFAGAGEEYYIWVSGDGSTTGNYELTMTCSPPVSNDLCEDAVALSCDVTVYGSTSFATDRDRPDEDCSEFSQTIGEGVWYTLVGTGGDINLSLCQSDFDTKILVLVGECGNFQCYAGNDDNYAACGSGFRSELTMPTTYGEVYTIYITGYTYSGGPQTGDFVLEVDCLCAPSQEAAECVTVYDGYDDPIYSTATLTAELQYAEEPISYAWSNGDTSQTTTVYAADGSQNYSVTMTDAAGCTGTQEFFVYAMDVNCDTKGTDKVLVCHNGQTICVAPTAVESHLQHGDVLGSCGSELCDELVPDCVAISAPLDGATDVELETTIEWSAATVGLVDGYNVTVLDVNGVEVVNENVGIDVLSLDIILYENEMTYTAIVSPYNSNGLAIGCQPSTFVTVAAPGCNDMVLTIDTGGFGYEVGWSITNSGGTVASAGYYSYSSYSSYDIPVSLPDDSYSFNMNDSYGDGWNGGTYTLKDGYGNIVSSGGLTGGSSGTNPFTVDCANAQPPSCNDMTINTNTGGFGYEVSWTLTGPGVNISSPYFGSSYSSYSQTATLPDGNYTMNMYDSYGDGWNGGTFEIINGNGSSIASGGLTSGSSGSVSFTVACGSARFATDIKDNTNTVLDWSMAPNPTKGNVTLDLTNYLQSDVTIDVMNITGKVIYNTSLTNLKGSKYNVELNNSLPAGMYFVRVAASGQVSTKKLMIMR